MADASQAFLVVCNPTGSSNNIVGFDFNLGPCIVRRIHITWPPGCGGLVGVKMYAGGSAAFPLESSSFLTFDDYTYAFDINNQTDTGKWSNRVYNVDTIAHGLQYIFEYDYIRGVGQQNAFVPVAL